MQNLGQRPAEASSRSVTPDRRKAGLEVSPVDAVTVSDGEGRENARGAADMGEHRLAGRKNSAETYLDDLAATERNRSAALRTPGLRLPRRPSPRR